MYSAHTTIQQLQHFIDYLNSPLPVAYFFIAYLSSITTMVLMLSFGRNELAEVNYRSRGRYTYTHQIIDAIIAGLFWPVTIAVVIYYHLAKTSKS